MGERIMLKTNGEYVRDVSADEMGVWFKGAQMPCSDPCVESVVSSLRERSAVGMAKYGVTVADAPIDFLGWVQHLQEELLDAAIYLERIKREKGV